MFFETELHPNFSRRRKTKELGFLIYHEGDPGPTYWLGTSEVPVKKSQNPIIEINGGSVRYQRNDLTQIDEKAFNELHGKALRFILILNKAGEPVPCNGVTFELPFRVDRWVCPSSVHTAKARVCEKFYVREKSGKRWVADFIEHTPKQLRINFHDKEIGVLRDGVISDRRKLSPVSEKPSGSSVGVWV